MKFKFDPNLNLISFFASNKLLHIKQVEKQEERGSSKTLVANLLD